MHVVLTVPASNERGPLYMEQALAAIHQANPHRLPLTLAFGSHGNSVSLSCRFPEELCATVEGQLYAQYPDCKIDRIRDEPEKPAVAWAAELHLHPDIFPIRRYGQFEDPLNRITADPLTAILMTLAQSRKSPIAGCVEITLRPAAASRRRRAVKCHHQLSSLFFRTHHRLAHLYAHLATSNHRSVRMAGWVLGYIGRPRDGHDHARSLETSGSRLHEREEDLQAAGDKLGRLLFEASIRLIVTGPAEAEDQAKKKLREMAGAFGQFSHRQAAFHMSRIHRMHGESRPLSTFLLSTEELATLWHPPTSTVRAPTMTTVEHREFAPPVELPTAVNHPGLAVLGITAFRSRRERFGILPDDRRRHVAIIGKTGMGKSTLLHQLIASDIQAGRGVGLIDPHGDLAEAVLQSIPRHRTNDVVLFDAGDSHPVAFNPLSCRDPAERPLVASGIVSTFKKVYGDVSWGPRLEYILRNAVLALLHVPGTSLVSLLRLLTDARYRQRIVSQVADPIIRNFWEREFAAMHAKLQIEAISPVLNKAGAFASSPILRNIIGQSRNRLDLRRLMDEGKVLIVNLSKGSIGDDASALLGSFLVTAIQLAAMSRADLPETARRDFFLYVDEFQNFATDSFAAILSEARKYRLNLTIANQYLAQMDEATLAAVFGNIGTLIAFQVGAQDAEIVAEQLGGDMTKPDLQQLPRYQAYVRLLIEGMPSRPFSMRTLPPSQGRQDSRRPDAIRRYSRQRYGQPIGRVETEIQATFSS